MQVHPFADFVSGEPRDWAHASVLLPPNIETSQLVEDWESVGYLASRFGSKAHIGNVMTVVDGGVLLDQLDAAEPISAHGWGQSARDARTVADIAVGQIESATHLLLTGPSSCCVEVGELLDVLNPTAERLDLTGLSREGLAQALRRSRGEAGSYRGAAASARVVPPWLDLLRADLPASCGRNHLLYRRSRPFDPERFGEWIAHPPREIVRGKGNVWLANRSDLSFGYSCAGSIHRVFQAGRWWVEHGPAFWPTCETARRRLLERWHPRFGDRRQEIVFVGRGLDEEAIAASLDACLLEEEEALALVTDSGRGAVAVAHDVPHVGLH